MWDNSPIHVDLIFRSRKPGRATSHSSLLVTGGLTSVLVTGQTLAASKRGSCREQQGFTRFTYFENDLCVNHGQNIIGCTCKLLYCIILHGLTQLQQKCIEFGTCNFV